MRPAITHTLILAMLGSSLVTAQESPLSQPKSQALRLLLDNDSSFGNDNNYTNGSRIDYMREWEEDQYWTLSFSQEMYTPYTNGPVPPPGEHPYAGLLALGVGFVTAGEILGISTELQIGVTGQPSLAEDTQRIVHDLGGFMQWEGWDSQVPSELTLQLSSRQELNIAPWGWQSASGWGSDSMLYFKEELGNVRISMTAGYIYRLGYNLPPTQRQAGCHRAQYAMSSLLSPDYNPQTWSLYLLAGIQGSYVAHDFSLDGGFFHDFDSTAKRVPWQLELQIGVGGHYAGVDFFVGAVLQSERFDDQYGMEEHVAFSIGWRW